MQRPPIVFDSELTKPQTGEYPLDPDTDLVKFDEFEIPYRAAPFFTRKKTVIYSEEEDSEVQVKTCGGDTEDVYNDDFDECYPEVPGLCRDGHVEVDGFDHDLAYDGIAYDPKKRMWKKMIHVASCFFGAIIGTCGSKLKEIEKELECRILVPRLGQQGPVEVLSYNAASSVRRAVERIEIIVIDNRAKKRFTHFVAIPANQKEIMKNYEQLRDKIFSSDSIPKGAKNPCMWYHSNKLHLTISMLILMDPYEEQDCAIALEKALEAARIELPKGKRLRVLIRGLDIMGDNPGETSVLYAKARCDHLQSYVDVISRAMLRTGYCPQKEARDHVKLHMTIANAKHAQDSDKRIYGFDVREIMKQFGTYQFGYLNVDKVVLNLRKHVEDRYEEVYSKEITIQKD
ncbi:hypothetical protein L596_018685 [Steinernema carpocapsae]|uniref:K Homology domain-containing protein n=1 Tax=Steinernema carpocapsae TaxID=34508 RepID=A0A4U5N643_STECR|nr:hypothetical protein L596_018685 [Steinernema carpocapsae]